jgi:phage-related protein
MEIIFFNSSVNDHLSSLEKRTYSKVFKQIKLLEKFELNLTMPYSKPISQNLFELRIRGQQEIRIFYCFYKNKIYLLNSFTKKTQKTPQREIDIAKKRISLLH